MAYSVVQTTYKKLLPAQYFEVYVNSLELSEFEAKAAINRAPAGILYSDLEYDKAEIVSACFTDKGIPCFVISDELISEVETVNVKKATFSSIIQYEDLYGNLIDIQVSELRALSIVFEQAASNKSTFDKEFILFLVLTDNRILKINSKRFNYSYLEGRLSTNITDNFVTALNDLNSLVDPSVFKSSAFVYALNGNFAEVETFENTKVLNSYLRWLSLDRSSGHFETETDTDKEVLSAAVIEEQVSSGQIESEEVLNEIEEEEVFFEEEQDYSEDEDLQSFPFELIEIDELGKRIKAAHKALSSGKNSSELINSMNSKGVPEDQAEVIVEILSELMSLESEGNLSHSAAREIFEDYAILPNIQKKFLSCFNIKVSNIKKSSKKDSFPHKKNALICMLISVVFFFFVSPAVKMSGGSVSTAYILSAILALSVTIGLVYCYSALKKIILEKKKGLLAVLVTLFIQLGIGALLFGGIYNMGFYKETVKVKMIANLCLEYRQKFGFFPRSLHSLSEYNPGIKKLLSHTGEDSSVDYEIYRFNGNTSSVFIGGTSPVRKWNTFYRVAIQFDGKLRLYED